MNVRILKAIAGRFGVYQAGAVVDVPEETAAAWCDAGIAAPVTLPATATITPPERAVLPKPRGRRPA